MMETKAHAHGEALEIESGTTANLTIPLSGPGFYHEVDATDGRG
jgi:hypothetical protein